jgi:hypothetical protein
MVALGACGEKKEDLSPSTDAATSTSTTPVVALEPKVAEARARKAASAALPKGIVIRPADWTVSCSGGESGGPWTCSVKGGRCHGNVIVRPPTGADGIMANAKGVRCTAA